MVAPSNLPPKPAAANVARSHIKRTADAMAILCRTASVAPFRHTPRWFSADYPSPLNTERTCGQHLAGKPQQELCCPKRGWQGPPDSDVPWLFSQFRALCEDHGRGLRIVLIALPECGGVSGGSATEYGCRDQVGDLPQVSGCYELHFCSWRL